MSDTDTDTDTDNIIRLDRGDKLLMGDPDPDVISCLEGLLIDARTGKLSSFALAGMSSDGFICVHWRGQDKATSVLGAIERLKYDMLRAIEMDERR